MVYVMVLLYHCGPYFYDGLLLAVLFSFTHTLCENAQILPIRKRQIARCTCHNLQKRLPQIGCSQRTELLFFIENVGLFGELYCRIKCILKIDCYSKQSLTMLIQSTEFCSSWLLTCLHGPFEHLYYSSVLLLHSHIQGSLLWVVPAWYQCTFHCVQQILDHCPMTCKRGQVQARVPLLQYGTHQKQAERIIFITHRIVCYHHRWHQKQAGSSDAAAAEVFWI